MKNKSFKLSFSINCTLNALKITLRNRNDFELTSFAFDMRQSFEAVLPHSVEIIASQS